MVFAEEHGGTVYEIEKPEAVALWAVGGLPRRVSLLLRIPSLLLTCSTKKLRQKNYANL